MNNLHVLPTANADSALRVAKEILAMCEKGEVVEFTATLLLKDGCTQTMGSALSSRTRMAGMLLQAAIERLTIED